MTSKPTKLKVGRLGISISDEMNENLALHTSEHLVVGEYTSGTGSSSITTIGLIVDNDGIAVNSTMADRRNNSSNYAAEIYGNTHINGDLIVNGNILSTNAIESGAGGGGGGGGGEIYWRPAFVDGTTSIYHDGKTTFGQSNDALVNQYTVNIAENADYSINTSHFAMQNRGTGIDGVSLFRMAILGDSSNSPIIFNTENNTPIEFHVGRKQEYFDSVYQVPQDSPNAPIYTSTPNYTEPSSAPHLNIDVNGNVGIKTNCNVPVQFSVLGSNGDETGFIDKYEPSSLHIEGTMYSCNILMHDYESGTQKHIDQLFVRRSGITIDTGSIVPGNFAKGPFTFNGDLTVNEDLTVGDDLVVNNNLTTARLQTTNSASFCNDIYVQENIYFKAGLYTEFTDEEGETRWERIQFDSSFFDSPSISNIYYIGTGIATIGRIGIGALPTRDTVNHQAVVIKRDPTIYELELTDKSTGGFKRTAFIGHPRVSDDFINDGSLVFLTPRIDDLNYNELYNNSKQNIYFYAGGGVSNEISEFIIESNNKPTLGVFANKRVGINTFDPTHELSVSGDISVSGAYYVKRDGIVGFSKMGIWAAETYPLIVNNADSTYQGISYINPNAPHVGINVSPSHVHGLKVASGVLSVDGYYVGTGVGNKLSPIYNSSNMLDKPQPLYEYMYANGQLGIGVVHPKATMHLNDMYATTSLRLSQSPISNSTLIHFNGTSTDYSWHLNDLYKTFELHYGNDTDISDSNVIKPLIAHRTLDGTHQVVINSNIEYAQSTLHSAALVVNGDVEIEGNLNVSGIYNQSGNSITIGGTPPEAYYNEVEGSENVYIGGKNVYINTDVEQMSAVFVGWGRTINDVPSLTDRAAMYVKNSVANSSFAMNYTTVSTTCLAKYNSTSASIVIGVTPSAPLFIGRTIKRPYIVGTSPSGIESIGIGTTAPNGARLHTFTSSQTQPLAHFTRSSGAGDTANVVCDITLEKVAGAQKYSWKIQGPNSAAGQKLQFLYGDNSTPLSEVLCLSKSGCVGIGNATPEFALDIKTVGDKGSIRMVQTDPAFAKPQLMFQSGPDAEFGGDAYTDYRVYASSNTFTIDSSITAPQVAGEEPTTSATNTLLHFSQSNNVGIRMIADDKYNVSIEGTLNVSDAIYIDGRAFFTIPDPQNATSIFEWDNISFNPNIPMYGGIIINGIQPTSNIFQVNSGQNGNLGVFNSSFDTSYIHFRNITEGEDPNNICRIGLSNRSFIQEFRSNISLNEQFISDSSIDYVRASELVYVENQFIEKLNGSIELTADAPSIRFNETSFIGSSNDLMYVMTNSVGVGTETPASKVHIVNSNEFPALIINQQTAIHDIINIVNSQTNTSLVVNTSGFVGIGTTLPEHPLHVSGNTALIGLLGVGTTQPTSPLHVIGDALINGDATITNNINLGGNGYVMGDFEIRGNLINDSDRSIKNDIQPIEDALEKIKQLSGYTFSKRDVERRETGVIAQEVQTVLPEAVFETNEGVLGVAYGNMVGLLIEGIKELSLKIDALKSS